MISNTQVEIVKMHRWENKNSEFLHILGIHFKDGDFYFKHLNLFFYAGN